MFQLETRNVETGVVYKSPLFNDFASARAEAQRVAMRGRRTVRVVQVPAVQVPVECTGYGCGEWCNPTAEQLVQFGRCKCGHIPSFPMSKYDGEFVCGYCWSGAAVFDDVIRELLGEKGGE
jgi:hypothetical protein